MDATSSQETRMSTQHVVCSSVSRDFCRRRLRKGQEFLLEHLLVVGPDQKDWQWIVPAVERACAFMARSKILSLFADFAAKMRRQGRT